MGEHLLGEGRFQRGPDLFARGKIRAQDPWHRSLAAIRSRHLDSPGPGLLLFDCQGLDGSMQLCGGPEDPPPWDSWYLVPERRCG